MGKNWPKFINSTLKTSFFVPDTLEIIRVALRFLPNQAAVKTYPLALCFERETISKCSCAQQKEKKNKNDQAQNANTGMP